ncbi:MAG: hypothetical protein EPO11_00405 [Gammaproteobacteria bacterium]|nr:MAG: hypothetical protein EPO11_00405 [Gammaproteobacteria bacterium]
MKRVKAKREYLRLAESAINAMYTAIDNFNGVYGKYKTETTLILLTNAWELLGKSILVKNKHEISLPNQHGKTIPAEITINKLHNLKFLDQHQSVLLQQIVSLRNESIHYLIPKIPQEIQHHLLYFSCKFFKELIMANFKQYADRMEGNFLSIAFDNMATYADKIQKIVGQLRRGSEHDKKLIWLLERGIQFNESNNYISQDEFERQYIGKKKIMPHLKINDFISNAEMVRMVPIQAPRGFTADIKLTKSNKKMNEALPVMIKKTHIEDDYPYLTSDLAVKLKKSTNFIAKTSTNLKLRNNPEYHQAIRASSSGVINRYSNQALSYITKFLEENPQYDPYKKKNK